MNNGPAAPIRNVAIVGHAGSGKTMLCESMLVCSGAIKRLGQIEAGTTTSDFHEDEKLHQMSLHDTLLRTTWLDRRLNLLDCPGFPDFVGEALGALRVADQAVLVIDAAQGIQLVTDQMWDQATRLGLPKMIVVNGLDREGVSFDELLAALRSHFSEKIFPLTLPLNHGPGFNRLLDVMRSEVVTYADDESGSFTEAPASGEEAVRVRELHRALIEQVAGSVDVLMEKFFEKDTLTEQEMRAGMHEALRNQAFIPVFCTSAQNDVGVARFLDFLAKYGFSPEDHYHATGLGPADEPVDVALDGGSAVAFVFKTSDDFKVGECSYLRVYSGELRAGMELVNATRGTTEKLGALFAATGRQRISIDVLGPGDIGATTRLNDTHTGDTLCQGATVRLPGIDFPKPIQFAALSLKNKGDEDRLANGLGVLREEDPTMEWLVHPETHQTVIGGQGELHLRILTEALVRRFRVEVELQEPRVPYRETIRTRADVTYRHKKQTGGAGQFAEVAMRIEPLPRNSGIQFRQSLIGQNVDRVFVPSVEKGVRSAAESGVLAGFPVTDIQVDFYDGRMHPVDSNDISFQIAGRHALLEALKAAQPFLLEPVYTVTIKVPDTATGDVMGDLSSRRGIILGMETEGQFAIIRANLPQAELFRYPAALKSLTQGRGGLTQEFSHYAEVPAQLQARIIQAHPRRG